MANANGEVRPRSLSSGSEVIAGLSWLDALILIGLGAGMVVLQATFRRQLHVPGHEGLEWMALLAMGRSFSRYRWAASVSSVAAASIAMVPVWGASDPFMWLMYFLPGLVMDLGFALERRWQSHIWFLAVLGGLGYATKPLLRFLISLATGWPYRSLWFGLAYPLSTHIAFGFLGGLLGAWLYWRARPDRSDKLANY